MARTDTDAPAAPVGAVVALCPPAETEGAEPREDGPDGAEAEADDPDTWLADLPAVEADPAKEAERRRLLAAIGHQGLRKMMAGGALNDLEMFHAVGDPDPTVYERWFARQPKPEFKPVALSEEDRAAIRHVTRHNPPWIRGEYLGFYRKPVPRELFEAPATAPANDDSAGPHPGPSPLTRERGNEAALASRPPSPPAGA